jgi:hypothetical protein
VLGLEDAMPEFLVLTQSTRRDGIMAKGEWRRGEGTNGPTATVCCPGCGKIASLNDHEIMAKGDVFPSLVCPFNCGFHEFVRLGEWKE